MSNIPNLASLARLRLGSGGGSTVRRKAFGFDGVNDYIYSNATIGRTGYDMNVSGNVTTGSDGDGDYIQFNGNRESATSTGTVANIGPVTTPAYTQATDFSFSFKFNSANLPAAGYAGIFGSGNNFAACLYDSNNIRITSKPTYSYFLIPYTPGTTVTIHVVYQASTGKAFGYKDGVLQNSGGTTMSTTFTTNYWCLGDLGNETLGAVTSVPTKVYHACIRNKALIQAEIDADIALGNTTKQDPSIVSYYIPENLQYNTQYGTNPNTFGGTGWTVGSNASVITNNAVAPDGTTTASTYSINVSGTAVTNAINQNVTTVSGATIASKTFIVKAFVRVASGVNTFRLQCSHTGVADYYSGNQTATTTRQEFTFTQTFTSSTSGTGIRYGLTSDTLGSAGAFEVAKVRLFLVNETLRDESPNIGGFIGRKTPLVMSARVKLGADAADTPTSQVIFKAPWHYLQARASSNVLQRRSETTLQARIAGTGGVAALGNGNRDKVHILGVKYRDGMGRLYNAYVNGVQTSGAQFAYSNTIRPAVTIYTTQLLVGKDNTAVYYTGAIRDARIYTFTGTFTDADALSIYNGGEPTSAGVTKYLHYKPPAGETGTTTQDQSSNDRDGTLDGGVTRIYI